MDKDYIYYRGGLKDPSLRKLNWYEEDVVKIFDTDDDFVLKIHKGDEHLIDILKEKNNLEFLKVIEWVK